jgi:hypothetical protein
MSNEFCSAAIRPKELDWFRDQSSRPHWDRKGPSALLDEIWQWPTQVASAAAEELEPLPDRFRRLADEWSKDVASVSSLSAMTRHPKYREIVALGWRIVPLMLKDLQQNHRFWFPALNEITGIQPFDNRDAGNSKRMIEAWIQWGKRRQMI